MELEPSLSDALEQWGLSHLLDRCKEQRFTLEGLLELHEGNVGVITPYVGEQVTLLKRLKEFKEANKPAVKKTHPAVPEGSAQVVARPHVAPAGNQNRRDAQPQLRTQPSSSGPATGKPKPTCSVSRKLSNLHDHKIAEEMQLQDVLSADVRGAAVVDVYKAQPEPALNQTQRDTICSVVVKYLLKKLANPTYHILPTIAHKIVQLFPTEQEETYFVAPKTESQEQTHPKGKLPNKLRNELTLQRNLRAAGLLPPEEVPAAVTFCKSSLAVVLKRPITLEVNAAAKWLQNGKEPWPLVLQKWHITEPLRFKTLFMNNEEKFVNSYLTDWPILSHKAGYELILQDFRALYPDVESLLLERWDVFMKNTLNLARKDIRHKPTKDFLQAATKLLESDQKLATKDAWASVLLYLLASIRPAHISKISGKRERISVEQSRDSYLVYSKVAADVKNVIRRRRELLKGPQGGGQPLIVLVGPSPTEIKDVHVSVADQLYTVTSVAGALDLFFKSFHALHLEYPPESSHIWLVLQRGIFKFETEWDSSYGIEYSWINEYK